MTQEQASADIIPMSSIPSSVIIYSIDSKSFTPSHTDEEKTGVII